MKIKIKKLHADAKLPTRSTDGSAGYDLTAVAGADDGIGMVRYSTGLAFEIPPGHVGLIFPRSSVCKTGLRLSNCVGVLDSDYRGEVTFVFDRRNVFDHGDNLYKLGERIGQIVIVELPQVEFVEADSLSDTARGAGGYGSTGK